MKSRWSLVAKKKRSDEQAVYGYFVNGILVGTYADFEEIYVASFHCYQSTKVHRQMYVSSIAIAKALVEEWATIQRDTAIESQNHLTEEVTE